MKSKNWVLPLLMGAFANTQIRIVGSIGISELIMCIIGPFIFMQDFAQLRKDGFGAWIFFVIFLNVGCVASSLYNNTELGFALRGFAATYSLFACTVCFHRVLRKDIGLFRFVLLGIAISSILNIFAFHQGAEGAEAEKLGGATVENIASGTLFWIGRLLNWVMLPIYGWYLQTPMWYSVLAPIGVAAYSIVGTGSGRSAALGVIGSVFFVMVGQKSSRRMQYISRHLFSIMIGAVMVVIVLKTGYMALGKHGLLNEKQMARYETQTEGGTKTGALSLLMHGRVEFFCGAYASFRRPIMGYGPWPIDYDGLYIEFLSKYGGPEDYENAFKTYEHKTRLGRVSWLPSHSQVIQFWQWFGLPGLLYMLYVLYLKIQYLRKYLHVIPQLYGYIASTTIAGLWHFFFSPYGNRVGAAVGCAVLLLNRAIAEGKVPLPEYMWRDKIKHDT